jgi:hypothetical protein
MSSTAACHDIWPLNNNFLSLSKILKKQPIRFIPHTLSRDFIFSNFSFFIFILEMPSTSYH